MYWDLDWASKLPLDRDRHISLEYLNRKRTSYSQV